MMAARFLNFNVTISTLSFLSLLIPNSQKRENENFQCRLSHFCRSCRAGAGISRRRKYQTPERATSADPASNKPDLNPVLFPPRASGSIGPDGRSKFRNFLTMNFLRAASRIRLEISDNAVSTSSESKVPTPFRSSNHMHPYRQCRPGFSDDGRYSALRFLNSGAKRWKTRNP